MKWLGLTRDGTRSVDSRKCRCYCMTARGMWVSLGSSSGTFPFLDTVSSAPAGSGFIYQIVGCSPSLAIRLDWRRSRSFRAAPLSLIQVRLHLPPLGTCHFRLPAEVIRYIPPVLLACASRLGSINPSCFDASLYVGRRCELREEDVIAIADRSDVIDPLRRNRSFRMAHLLRSYLIFRRDALETRHVYTGIPHSPPHQRMLSAE